MTLFMSLLAGFQLLLCRYSGQEDVVVGTPVANRWNRLEIEGLIGFFVNTLALRTPVRGDPSFRELLQRVKETVLGAFLRTRTYRSRRWWKSCSRNETSAAPLYSRWPLFSVLDCTMSRALRRLLRSLWMRSLQQPPST